MKAALLWLFLAGMAEAQEFITADAPLSDTDFYRLVACGAPGGQPCQKDLVRWSAADASDISIGIVQIEDGYPPALAKQISVALDMAIAEVNASHANLHLTHSDNEINPDIGIHLLTIREGDEIRGTGLDPLDGTKMQAARAQLWWRADFSLITGAIVFGMDISDADLPSIMLEEVTQSMGLLTDIGGKYYETQSIFSESSNTRRSLGRQDIIALRRHYP